MSADEDSRRLRVAVVGPCTSGKSTLTAALLALGYDARQPAQEHSYVPDMWQRLVKPDVLVYLDVSYEAARQRRKISWGPERLDKQAGRLAHARQHANLYIDTSSLTADQVQARVIDFLIDRPAG
jgi:thymidylate kinase